MEHPGRRIEKRFMEPLGINASELARALGVNRSTVSRILAGGQPVTLAMAARLGVCFGVPARWFLLMQAEFDVEQITADAALTTGATPLDIDPDWMLTPDGAISLTSTAEPPVEVPAVRTVRLDNGAVALLSEAL
jgi:addiction module HigA family antidote